MNPKCYNQNSLRSIAFYTIFILFYQQCFFLISSKEVIALTALLRVLGFKFGMDAYFILFSRMVVWIKGHKMWPLTTRRVENPSWRDMVSWCSANAYIFTHWEGQHTSVVWECMWWLWLFVVL
jgi:hypothetical protein